MNVTFSTTTTTNDYIVTTICQRCGGAHYIEACPQVKAIEYDEQHRIKRIEFLTPGDYMPPMDNTPIPLGPVTWKPPYDITATTTHIAKYGDDAQIFWTVT